jgi:hypothetical protein
VCANQIKEPTVTFSRSSIHLFVASGMAPKRPRASEDGAGNAVEPFQFTQGQRAGAAELDYSEVSELSTATPAVKKLKAAGKGKGMANAAATAAAKAKAAKAAVAVKTKPSDAPKSKPAAAAAAAAVPDKRAAVSKAAAPSPTKASANGNG